MSVSGQFLNVSLPASSVTVDGNTTRAKLVHDINKAPGMMVTPSGMTISFSCVQYAKALKPMVVTVAGNSLLLKSVLSKAYLR